MNVSMKEYLQQSPLEESLVLSIDFDHSTRRVEFVYDYAAEVVSRHFESSRDSPGSISGETTNCRDFRKLVFHDVSHFVVARAGSTTNEFGLSELNAIVSESTIVVNAARLSQDNRSFKLWLELSNGITVEIVFTSASLRQKTVRALRVPGQQEWRYLDTETGERVEFDSPFS